MRWLLAVEAAGTTALNGTVEWQRDVNQSPLWQDRIFHTLAMLYIWSKVCESPVVIAVFSYLRRDPKHCSAVARGLLGLPLGAFLNAFGTIVLGAHVGMMQVYGIAITYWSLLVSLFTLRFIPTTFVYGASKTNWQNMLSHTILPIDVTDYMISTPCHGAVIGAWLGAWSMPLDWERAWREWPISVTYGAVTGHLVGMAVIGSNSTSQKNSGGEGMATLPYGSGLNPCFDSTSYMRARPP